GGWVVDGKDRIDVRVALKDVLRDGKRSVTRAAGGELDHNLNAGRLGRFLQETFLAHHSRLNLGMVDDRHAPFPAEGFDDGSAGDAPAFQVVGCAVAGDL